MVHSFAIHEPQCRELFEQRENLKPVKERRPCPVDPAITLKTNNIDALNAAGNTGSLIPCIHCNRTFMSDKLRIHHKSCTAKTPARRVDEPIKRGDETRYDEHYDNGNMMMCKECGRTFNSTAFSK